MVADRESAVGWVSSRSPTALKARTADARRWAREGKSSPPPPSLDPVDAFLREVRDAVADELVKLPEEYASRSCFAIGTD